jgi:hypothetical protein
MHNYFSQRLEQISANLLPQTAILITKGDKDRHAKLGRMLATRAKFVASAVGLAAAFAINLLSTFVYERL